MENNGYEKYSKWFDVIESMCDESHFEGETEVGSGIYKHYKLDNGLYVYKLHDGSKITIMDEILDPTQGQTCMRKYDTDMQNDVRRVNIGLNTQDGFFISYIREESILYENPIEESRCYLPNCVDPDKYEDMAASHVNLPSDMVELLNKAYIEARETGDAKISTQYLDAINLHNQVYETVRPKLIEEQENSKLINSSIEELEERLKTIQDENKSKQGQLDNLKKKQELIQKIRLAQEEGIKLDEAIMEAEKKFNVQNKE